MGRKKKTDVAPAPTTVGHGCLDCVSYELPLQKQPCKSCKNWSGWEPNDKYLRVLEVRKQIEKEIEKKGQKYNGNFKKM